MKARKLSAGIWAVVMLLSGLGMLGILSVPVVAPPNMHFFSGSITYNGIDAPVGTEVFAEIDGTLYGQDSVYGGTGGYVGGVYSFAVSGEDTADPAAKEGGVNGENIIFWVLVPGEPQPYIANQAPVYTDGNVDTLNLVVQSIGQPLMARLNQISHQNTSGPSDWVQLYNPSAASNVDLTQGWSLADNYGGSWAFGAGDILPPLGVSPAPHNVDLVDVDGNVKLVWDDPLDTIAGTNPVVMDKAEWGLHLGDTEASGGDTIGLDKGAGSVWDPNLADCGAPDIGYARIDPNVDTDKDTDWVCGGGLPEIPELWPLGTVGYETDYLDPETGDSTTNFVWQVWYTHSDNDAPTTGPLLHIYDQATMLPIPASPFTMTFSYWKGAPNDYIYPAGGAIYVHTMSGFAVATYCYYIEVTAANGMSNQTTDMCFIIGDATAPEIQNVLLNGMTSQVVNPGDMVLLTSDIDDSMTGNSNIGGAEWSLNCTAPWTAMTAQDGAFDEIAETAVFNINTAAMSGVYEVHVRAWDVVPNTNNSCLVFATLSVGVDTLAPNIYEPLVNGQPQVTVTPGTMVTFTAIIDDTGQGDGIIGGAMYKLGVNPDVAMAAQDGAFDETNETATADIDTTGLADGPHTICVSDAWDDAVPANHDTSATMCATINIDGTAPTITNIRMDGVAISHSVPEGATTTLTADLDDTFTGNSNIANASFSFEGAMGIAMLAADGTFDSPAEGATYDIVTGVAPYVVGGPYQICVYGSDVLGNDNMVGACMDLTITLVDDEAPLLANLAVDGQPSKSVEAGTMVVFTGDVDDTTRGASDIQNATYLVRDGSGVVYGIPGVMAADDGTFDQPMETVTVDIDTTGWPLDNYTLHIFACDAWTTPNCNYDETEQATLTIAPPTDDVDPPEISNVAADVVIFQIATRTTINLTATVTDINTAAGPPSKVGGANYTDGATSWPGAPMTAADGTFDETSEDVEVEIDVMGWGVGTRDLYVYGIDEHGNANITSTEYVTIEVTLLPPDVDPPVIGTISIDPDDPEEGETVTVTVTVTDDISAADDLTVTITITGPGATPIVTDAPMTLGAGDTFTYPTPALDDVGTYTITITATDEASNPATDTETFSVSEAGDGGGGGIDWWIWVLLIIIIIVIVVLIVIFARRKPEEEIPPEVPPEEEELPEEEMVEEEAAVVVEEEMPPEEVAEEPAMEEEAPMEEAPAEEAPTEEAAAAGPTTCPNCGTVNPEGISVCTSCGSPL